MFKSFKEGIFIYSVTNCVEEWWIVIIWSDLKFK